jgi:hypothetical protein
MIVVNLTGCPYAIADNKRTETLVAVLAVRLTNVRKAQLHVAASAFPVAAHSSALLGCVSTENFVVNWQAMD